MLRLTVALGLSAALSFAAFLALGEAGPPVIPYKDAGRVTEGATLYETHCAGCHGTDLAGEPDWRSPGSDGLMPAPPHDETGHTWHHPDAQLFEITKHGTAAIVGNGYESRMAGFGEVLSDTEILSVLAYIKSTWPARVIQIHEEINGRPGG